MSFPDKPPGGFQLGAVNPETPDGIPVKGPGSSVSSGPSMRSDRSKGNPPDLTGEGKSCASMDSGYAPSLPDSSVSAGRVLCDVCTDRALKTCLTCMASYCWTHVKDHYTSPDLDRHQLQDLPHQDRCDQHNRQLEFYCRTDQSAVCSRCLLHNHKGHDVIEQNPQGTYSDSLIRQGVPPPGQIQFPSVLPNSVTVSWSPPEGTAGPHKYKVTWRRGHDERSLTVVGLAVKVTELIPGEKYDFAVATLSEDGHQSSCVEASVHTEVPPPESLSVDLRAVTASVTWSRPAGVDQVSYLLELHRDQVSMETVYRDSPQYTTIGLQHGAEYTISVATVLRNGRQSKPTCKTLSIAIPVPERLTVSSITASSARLSWEVSPEMKQTPHSFLVSYQSEGTELKSISTESCSADITGLKPGTEYTVEVYTELQHGGKSQPAMTQMTTEHLLPELLSALGLKDLHGGKLTLSSALEINSNTVSDEPAQNLEQVPWTFLRKLMMSNLNARNIKCVQDQSKYDFSFSDANDDCDAINPVDLITALFHCSDPFLQQEMVSKMSMCQFAVPLLLPNCDTQQCTLMLWAMRDLVKKFRIRSLSGGKSFIEGRIVEMDIPMVSFVRLGESSLSKSQILNKLISNPQQHNDTFVHRDMECGDVPRRISDGLVEVSWYLPCGNPNIDKFSQPVAMANLRGDGRSFKTQMSFLCQTSAAVFIFCDDLDLDLSTLTNRGGKTELFLVTSSQRKNFSTETLRDTCRRHRVKEQNVIIKDRQNDVHFVKTIRFHMSGIVESKPNKLKVESMVDIARDVGIQVDEDGTDCKNGRIRAKEITGNIKDVLSFKEKQLPLHGEIWKEISKLEKERCRMRKAGKDIEHYQSKLKGKEKALRKKQHELNISDAMVKFTAGISQTGTEHLYFLKWLKIQLDTLCRHDLSKLRGEYKECCKSTPQNKELIGRLDQQISNCSLGPEHFFRELGQLYECACYLKENNPARQQVQHLPALCAQMLLDGFPVELVDGDASNIPMKWISEVLTQLHQLVESQSRILVLTVLGVQSTGKSTLLNTMFGVQFAVSSGRCTRGAFMLLIKVSEKFRSELKCDFIMVIDTEGLKSPELATLETSYEHDNELATLVIGLSDITIINIAMENNTEMKDILQIVVHAFLRMKEVGRKPRCLFVHQNVSDMSAHDNNMRDRKKLLEQLDEMTQAAAKMEKREANTKFSDVMVYDPDKDSYYIPGLWHGTPPMAPVNAGYSEAVYELKRSLIHSIQKSDDVKRNNAKDFLKWTEGLWDAVKYEKFIFSFRNSLVADAYAHLYTEYNKWEWSFQKEMISWHLIKDTMLSNFGMTGSDDHGASVKEYLREIFAEASGKLNEEEKKIHQSLEKYFKSKDSSVALVERYKDDFKISAKCLRRETENSLISSMLKAVEIKEGLEQVNIIKNTETEKIEKIVQDLVQSCRKRKKELCTAKNEI